MSLLSLSGKNRQRGNENIEFGPTVNRHCKAKIPQRKCITVAVTFGTVPFLGNLSLELRITDVNYLQRDW